MNTDTVVLDGSCRLINRMDGRCSLTNVLDGCVMPVLVTSEFDYYTGAYEVIPRAYEEVILPTQGLMMSDDVTVHRVPYFLVHNDSGNTVYIASEVDDNGN